MGECQTEHRHVQQIKRDHCHHRHRCWQEFVPCRWPRSTRRDRAAPEVVTRRVEARFAAMPPCLIGMEACDDIVLFPCRGLREDETRWRTGHPGACEPGDPNGLFEACPLRERRCADIHDGPEHNTLQSEAGYIMTAKPADR